MTAELKEARENYLRLCRDRDSNRAERDAAYKALLTSAGLAASSASNRRKA